MRRLEFGLPDHLRELISSLVVLLGLDSLLRAFPDLNRSYRPLARWFQPITALVRLRLGWVELPLGCESLAMCSIFARGLGTLHLLSRALPQNKSWAHLQNKPPQRKHT